MSSASDAITQELSSFSQSCEQLLDLAGPELREEMRGVDGEEAIRGMLAMAESPDGSLALSELWGSELASAMREGEPGEVVGAVVGVVEDALERACAAEDELT